MNSIGQEGQKLLYLKKRVKKRVPREAASQEIYDLFLKEKRPKGYSKANWSRSRLAITSLRHFGLRASEAGLLTLKDLGSLLEGTDMLNGQRLSCCFSNRTSS